MSAAPPIDALAPRLAELTLADEHRLRGRLRHLEGKGGSPRKDRPQQLARLTADLEQAEARIARRRAAVPAVTYPPQLPVSERKDDLLAAIRDHQVVVVAGETGSGKTTQLPKICLELGRGVRGAIGHTQPRRIAARTVADRIAEELGTPLGQAVGYAVRFDDRSGEDTLVRLVTDGLLLAEIQHDRLLRRYDTIIVDEAHERSLTIDFLLGYLREILPRRPDLKLIITSATIDPQRFSRHFGDAPIVEVSGRTYPVEVRYQPLGGDPAGSDSGGTDPDGADEATEGEGDAEPIPERDPVEAIGDAVEELLAERLGDVLVFLSGEREIRDTADALKGRLRADVDILPLYARLSTQEQQKVFRPTGRPRVVLATNVAETSLTVPGIRSVVDPGTARISRYSARLKVQRLPIERISQASADQRKGRCGRTSDGVCIRLYSEQDFDARPVYTDPEILRTSLAAVILQMASLGLAAVEDFGFLDPPDRRQIRDGMNLLHELGAIDPEIEDPRKRLTPLGRRLAQLPVDPRLGRMVLEADRLRCAEEVIRIAAALSIQDPRERPADQRAQADQQHARFTDETSDFVAFLNLWDYVREQRRELSGSQFRKRLKAEHLHVLRIREWQDLAGSLRSSAKAAGVTLNQQPAAPEEIHQALLAGLLSHVGLRDAGRREYVGARGARFGVFPGSSLSRKQPPWVMAAELVETSRLWGRVVAQVRPEWIEQLGGHLLKRTYENPQWDRKRGAVVATERATLYGLPVVPGRRVAYGRIDPEAARDLFLRRALVEREWESRHHFLAENDKRLEEVEALERRERRRDLRVSDQVLYDFYAERVPADVVSGAHFDRWWREARRADPELLTFPSELLIAPQVAAAIDPRDRPPAWRQGELTLPLTYDFAPGADRDGVTVHVPLKVLPQLRPDGFEWLVPGLRLELVTALIRALPKPMRRVLVPAPDVAAEVLARLKPRAEPLREAVAREIHAVRGLRVDPAVWDDAPPLPAHLRMSFRVEAEDGSVVAEGEDLAALRASVQPRLREELSAATASFERHGLTDWGFGTLPQAVALPGTGKAVRAYPALVDEGATVGVRALDTPGAQARAMAAGTRRLLLLTVPSPAKDLLRRLPGSAQLTLAAAPHASVGAVVDDCILAAIDGLTAQAGGPAWDESAWRRLRDHVAGHLHERAGALLATTVRVLDAHRIVRLKLDALEGAAIQPARLDLERQLGRLVFPGFVAATGATRLPDVERYLKGAAERIDRLPDQLAADRDRMAAVHELEAERDRRRAAIPAGSPVPAAFRASGLLLEELRLSHFAPGVPPRGPVSSKRVRKLLDEVR